MMVHLLRDTPGPWGPDEATGAAHLPRGSSTDTTRRPARRVFGVEQARRAPRPAQAVRQLPSITLLRPHMRPFGRLTADALSPTAGAEVSEALRNGPTGALWRPHPGSPRCAAGLENNGEYSPAPRGCLGSSREADTRAQWHQSGPHGVPRQNRKVNHQKNTCR